MNPAKLQTILTAHTEWMHSGGKAGKRANLQGANLQWAHLQGANLRGADLQGADLQGTNLRGANLRGANLQGANLQGANLRGADLPGTNLQGANLQGANLQWANLRGANLQGANLRGAGLIVLHLPIWTAYITKTHTHIGCKRYTHGGWFNFSDDEISAMDSEALVWWHAHKPLILATIEAVQEQD